MKAVVAVLVPAAAALAAGSGPATGSARSWPVPTPIGAGPRFQPSAESRTVTLAAPIGRLDCRASETPRVGVHLEIFAEGRVVVVPAGIGMSAGCSYPLRTVDRTGVVEVEIGARATLGDLFDVWARPLGDRRIGSFAAAAGERVAAFVDGQAWRPDPRAIPLRRHGQIVLELGPRISPHAAYAFPPGL